MNLKTQIKRVSHAIPKVNGYNNQYRLLHLEHAPEGRTPNTMAVIATDGHRMAVEYTERPEGLELPLTVAGGTVERMEAAIRAGDRSFGTAFPPWRNVLAAFQPWADVRLERKELLAVLRDIQTRYAVINRTRDADRRKRVTYLRSVGQAGAAKREKEGKGEDHLVRVVFQLQFGEFEGGLVVRHHEETAAEEARVAATIFGDPEPKYLDADDRFIFAVNVNYLVQALQSLPGQYVRLQFSGDLDPVTLSEVDGPQTHVSSSETKSIRFVMPVRP